MILEENEDKDGRYFKAGLITRYALTLENYAGAEWGNRFYSSEFLSGFCERRNEAHAQVAKATGSLIVATTILAFFENVSGSIAFWGVEISIPETGSLALCVLISVNFFVLTGYFLNQLVFDRLLDVLGNRIGAFSFELVLLDKTSQNLWIAALAPKFHGLKSGRGQLFAFGLTNVLFGIFAFAFLAYPLSVVGTTLFNFLQHEPGMFIISLSAISVFMLFFSFVIIFIFALDYRFRPSGLSEPSDPFISDSFMEMGHPPANERRDGEEQA